MLSSWQTAAFLQSRTEQHPLRTTCPRRDMALQGRSQLPLGKVTRSSSFPQDSTSRLPFLPSAINPPPRRLPPLPSRDHTRTNLCWLAFCYLLIRI